MHVVASAVVGLVFGVGLLLSGMTDPEKILNFLDFAGRWDPSLIFVMAGAISVTFVGYRLVLRRNAPVFATAFSFPGTTAIDHRVILGPAIFGVGWGLTGFCPGPAIASLSFGGDKVIAFVVALVAGLAIARAVLDQHGERLSIDPEADQAALPRRSD